MTSWYQSKDPDTERSPRTRRWPVLALLLAGSVALGLYAAGRHDSSASREAASSSQRVSGATNASFSFSAREAGVSYLCSLDGDRYRPCVSPKRVSKLAHGPHTFAVLARTSAGVVSDPATTAWTVAPAKQAKAGAPATFAPTGRSTGLASSRSASVSGEITALFYPGLTLPLNLVFANPTSAPLTVKRVSIVVQRATTKPGCNGPTNLRLANPDTRGGSVLTFPVALSIPSGTTRSLSALGLAAANWPRIVMPNLPVNQDACQNATFTFVYDFATTATAPLTPPAVVRLPSISQLPGLQTIPSGGQATFRIRVENSTRLTLRNVTVRDPRAAGCARRLKTLAAGAVRSYTCTRSHVDKGFTSVASASGKRPNGARVTASAAPATVKVAVFRPPTARSPKPPKPDVVAHISPSSAG